MEALIAFTLHTTTTSASISTLTHPTCTFNKDCISPLHMI